MTTQTEIPIPPQPPELAKFKRQEQAWWKAPLARSFRPVKIIDHYDYKSTYRVLDGHGEVLVFEGELYTEQEKDELLLMKDRLHYAQVMKCWLEGHKTPQAMAAVMGGPAVKWHSQIAAARRRGFIE